MDTFPKLFEPGKIGSLELKNRIVMSPMGTYSGDGDGNVTQRTIDYYVARADGGTALLSVGAVPFLREARAPRRIWLFDDIFIPTLSALPKAVHAHGGKIAVQLIHHGKALAGLLAQFTPEQAAGLDVVGPSAQASVADSRPTRELTHDDIERIVEAYAEAGRRVRDAGFDAVMIHGAHGYLIDDFRSNFTNHRTDEYGGSLENRARFGCEVIRRMRKKVGTDFPIILRMNAAAFTPGGSTLDEALAHAPMFVEAGADALDVSAAVHETMERQNPTYFSPDGPLVQYAAAVKRVVNVPIIAVAKLSNPAVAERALREGKADFISIGRGLMADPQLPNKARQGRADDVVKCIYCMNCFNRTTEERAAFGGGLFCTVNPGLFREATFDLVPVKTPKRVMVVGGGLAGMQAAADLAERGHSVDLYERDDQLGGQWAIACTQPSKSGFQDVTNRLMRRLEETGVNVRLNTCVTTERVRAERPDAVVIATGAIPTTHGLRGSDNPIVVQALDVISGKVETGKNIVVVGGRLVGMEVADQLMEIAAESLAQQGKRVSIVTRRRLGEGRQLPPQLYRALRDRLIVAGVHTYPSSAALEITSEGVWANDNGHLMLLPADTVVIAVGLEPDRALMNSLEDVVPELYHIGDVVEPRDALAAIREGAEVARKI